MPIGLSRRAVGGQLVEDQDVALTLKLELVEQAPHRLVAADGDQRQLGADHRVAHRRQLAVAGEVLAGGRLGLVEERVLEEASRRSAGRRARGSLQRAAQLPMYCEYAELDVAADDAPGVVVEPRAEVHGAVQLRQEAVEPRGRSTTARGCRGCAPAASCRRPGRGDTGSTGSRRGPGRTPRSACSSSATGSASAWSARCRSRGRCHTVVPGDVLAEDRCRSCRTVGAGQRAALERHRVAVVLVADLVEAVAVRERDGRVAAGQVDRRVAADLARQVVALGAERRRERSASSAGPGSRARPCPRGGRRRTSSPTTPRRPDRRVEVAPRDRVGRVAGVERDVAPEVDADVGLRMDDGQAALVAGALLREHARSRPRRDRRRCATRASSTQHATREQLWRDAQLQPHPPPPAPWPPAAPSRFDQDVIVGRGLVRIVVEHHHLIGEEFLLRRAHGGAAAADARASTTSTGCTHELLRRRSRGHRCTPVRCSSGSG